MKLTKRDMLTLNITCYILTIVFLGGTVASIVGLIVHNQLVFILTALACAYLTWRFGQLFNRNPA